MIMICGLLTCSVVMSEMVSFWELELMNTLTPTAASPSVTASAATAASASTEAAT